MKHKGPIITLAAGVLLAAILMLLNLNANAKSEAQRASAEATATTGSPGLGPAASSPAAIPTPAPTPTVEAGPPATYAGTVGGGGATIAIAVKDGKAIAYLCDGRSAEAWLQGTASGGKLTLTGADSASLSGTYANGVAAGSVTATGRAWDFSVGAVQAPSGLYRASANVSNAQIVGGWIVRADGTQVGTQRKGTTITAAPPLNVSTKSTVLDGAAVTATMLDGTKL